MTKSETNKKLKKTKTPIDQSVVDYNEKVLEVKNLKKYFKVGVGRRKLTVPAVDNITFDVYKREVFGLVGESGSGKTTAGRTIIKLYNATEGSVDLNGIRISAGYADLVAEIKKLKRQRKEDIINLYPNKKAKLEIKKKTKHEIFLLDHQIKEHRYNLEKELKIADKEEYQYRENLYEIKNKYRLSRDYEKYDANLKISLAKEKGINLPKQKLDEELAIAKTKYTRKVEGFKDSAALSKDAVKENLKVLELAYKAEVESLKADFESKIREAQEKIVPKSEVNKEIKEIVSQRKINLKALQDQYQIDITQTEKPDYEANKAARNEIVGKYKTLIEEIELKKKELKEQEKLQIQSLEKDDPTIKKTNKERTLEIKTTTNETIKDLRNQIATIKVINKSRETLEASRKMQMIFQDPISSLNPRMTVKEIIGEGLIIKGGYSAQEITEKVEEVLDIVGLAPEYATRYPHEFSGGQRQRIGIARALIMNPNFIIADEPISALDVSIRAQVINLMTNLKEKLGLTILFIAHDLSVVRFFCDRIAVMFNGKIVELATSEEIFKNPMHPYTKSLLSAIPQPDPDYEKGRKRLHYDPRIHNYLEDKPSLREIAKGHMVYANEQEFKEMKKVYKK